MALYHYLTGFPLWYKPHTGQVRVAYSDHALAEATYDKYGPVPCLDKLDLSKALIVEIETNDRWPRGGTQRVSKVVARIGIDDKRDGVYVIRWLDNRPTVITAWSNLKRDQHVTLRKDRYRAGRVQAGTAT